MLSSEQNEQDFFKPQAIISREHKSIAIYSEGLLIVEANFFMENNVFTHLRQIVIMYFVFGFFGQDNKKMKKSLEEEQRARKELEKLVRKVLKSMNDPSWDETNL